MKGEIDHQQIAFFPQLASPTITVPTDIPRLPPTSQVRLSLRCDVVSPLREKRRLMKRVWAVVRFYPSLPSPTPFFHAPSSFFPSRGRFFLLFHRLATLLHNPLSPPPPPFQNISLSFDSPSSFPRRQPWLLVVLYLPPVICGYSSLIPPPIGLYPGERHRRIIRSIAVLFMRNPSSDWGSWIFYALQPNPSRWFFTRSLSHFEFDYFVITRRILFDGFRRRG